MTYTKEFFDELPLNPKNYDLMHTIAAGQLELEAFKAYYAWYGRYHNVLKPIIKYWFLEVDELFAQRFEE
jgi:hypothetical protein